MKTEELKEITVYRDGSGNAYEIYNTAQDKINEKMAEITKLKSFLEKYKDILAGASYTACLFIQATVEIFCHGKACYRKDVMTPRDFAAKLFPAASWEKVQEEFGENYHYEAVIDGVMLRLKNAEVVVKRRANVKPKRARLALP